MPLIWERHFGAAAQAGLAEGGRGWTMFGLLYDPIGQVKIPIDQFRCPTDTREYKLNSRNFAQPTAAEVANLTIFYRDFSFDYAALAIGWGRPDRRLPWSVAQSDTTTATRGATQFGSIKKPSQVILVWDFESKTFTVKTGAAQLGTSADWPAAARRNYAVFRHGLRGPNSLFADGHVEQKFDWDSLLVPPWNDDYFTLPR
jgi:prepilin-type processing-associated H-X9-DG protein